MPGLRTRPVIATVGPRDGTTIRSPSARRIHTAAGHWPSARLNISHIHGGGNPDMRREPVFLTASQQKGIHDRRQAGRDTLPEH